ncbi:MAG: alanine racemase [Candidatus Falkowbacteria bacterium]
MLSDENRGLRTWFEISRANLEHNYQVLRRLLGTQTRFLAVAKSNAYGHSLVDYARAVEELGVDFLGLDSVLEAFRLRDQGIKAPMLVLGYTLLDNVSAAAALNISLTVSSWPGLEAIINKAPKGLKIHLKFDTGMCRQGFFPNEARAVLDRILAIPEGILIIEGVYTHFAGAKNPAFPAGTKNQMTQFEEVLAEFTSRGLAPIRHAAATSGAIAFPEAHYDMVRVGIGLMGLWPSREVEYAFADKLDLRPILQWKTVVSEVKTVPAGSRVGYDGTEVLERPTIIAVLPIGYWHGYDRSLSSLGRVIINGHRARVLGRVSMDMIVVDVTDAPEVTVGDEAILLGSDGTAEFSADEMADLAGTSNYEIITRLNPLIKRIYG